MLHSLKKFFPLEPFLPFFVEVVWEAAQEKWKGVLIHVWQNLIEVSGPFFLDGAHGSSA